MAKQSFLQQLRHARRVANNKGFTLLEILVVLVIMGFLIAMVAPRFAGMSDSAVDTVCDTNQSRMTSMISAYVTAKGGFPSNMTNLVLQNGSGYELPAVSDDDPANGPEPLAGELMDRNKFRLHILDADEARELRRLGVSHVLNLNDYSGVDAADIALADRRATMHRVPVEAGVGVLMVGVGHDGTDWDLETDERGWGEADWLGRIVLGFGPENGLITDGMIANAAHCPGGIQDAANVTYNDYNLVLPRLGATVARTGWPVADEITAVAYDDAPAADYVYTAATNLLKVRSFEIAGQEAWQYASMCPEGHMFPADGQEFWAIDFNGNGQIN